ncbi:MAG TPA: hypothetical protein VF832_00565 [Longimicrobiales bacterium]
MRQGAVGRLRALAIWGGLASFGIAVGLLALLRNLERTGAGGRWRRADVTAGELDALLRAQSPDVTAESGSAAPPGTPR